VGIIGLRVGIGLTTFLDRNVVPGSTKYVDPGTWKHHSDMFICKSLFILSCTKNYFYNKLHVFTKLLKHNVGLTLFHLHSKKCWVVLTQLWVKYGQTQPLGKIFFNDIFNPTFGFVHI